MSLRVMSAVWSGAPYEDGALLVLFALADHADKGGVRWPSIEAIAKKAVPSAGDVRRTRP